MVLSARAGLGSHRLGTAVSMANKLSRDFWRRSNFDFYNKIGTKRTCSPRQATSGSDRLTDILRAHCDFAFCPRLCNNPDGQLACRTSISISSKWESIVLATSLERRQLRKRFFAFFVQSRFHTGWTRSGHFNASKPSDTEGNTSCDLS